MRKRTQEPTLDRTDGQMHPDDEQEILECVGEYRDALSDVSGAMTYLRHAAMCANSQLRHLNVAKLHARARRMRNGADAVERFATLINQKKLAV